MKFPTETKFSDKLKKAVKLIKKEANGRKCGKCRWFGATCLRPIDCPWEIELYWQEETIACQAFEMAKGVVFVG